MHDANQSQTQNAEPASNAAPTSAPVEANGSVKAAKQPSLSTETSFLSQHSATGGIVESPQAVHQSHSSATLADYGAHLSGHEARAFPGIFTRGTRSGSTRKEDGALGAHETAECNSS